MTPDDARALDDAGLAAEYLAASEANDWPVADVLEAEIDRRYPPIPLVPDRLKAPGALGAAALWYARRGVPVFPLARGSKIPHPGSAGFKDATTDLRQVEHWWRQRPASNIGAATGHKFDVLDVDGITGWRALDDLDVTIIGRSRTARPGGWHLFIPPTGAGNKAHIGGQALDLRSLGGYVVLPPSRLGDKHYRWVEPLEIA